MNDPLSRVAEIVARDAVSVRRPEKETRPKLFYKGADQVTLDPLAAQRPPGGQLMWSQAGSGSHAVESGHPGPWNNSAAAVLSYDVPHKAPWDFRVSLYTWTKSIAAGAYLAPLLAALGGWLPWSSGLWTWWAPVVSMIFLGLTGALLIWDLEHPERFYMIFTRPQWRSWLVRGGVVITAYGAVLAAHLVMAATGRVEVTRTLAWAGGPLALFTAVYTAYLFAQARARDLWQNPLLPAHLAFQAVMAGAGTMLLAALSAQPDAAGALTWLFAGATAVHALLALGEATAGHPTAHAKLAAHEMTGGRYAVFFWSGLALAAVAVAAPWVSPLLALAGLAGLLLHEHAYVQAAQTVPLA
jgi:formate-dependent nitrite reductase membrane component NrfD